MYSQQPLRTRTHSVNNSQLRNAAQAHESDARQSGANLAYQAQLRAAQYQAQLRAAAYQALLADPAYQQMLRDKEDQISREIQRRAAQREGRAQNEGRDDRQRRGQDFMDF